MAAMGHYSGLTRLATVSATLFDMSRSLRYPLGTPLRGVSQPTTVPALQQPCQKSLMYWTHMTSNSPLVDCVMEQPQCQLTKAHKHWDCPWEVATSRLNPDVHLQRSTPTIIKLLPNDINTNKPSDASAETVRFQSSTNSQPAA